MQTTAGMWHKFPVPALATGLMVAILPAASAEDGDIAAAKVPEDGFNWDNHLLHVKGAISA